MMKSVLFFSFFITGLCGFSQKLSSNPWHIDEIIGSDTIKNWSVYFTKKLTRQIAFGLGAIPLNSSLIAVSAARILQSVAMIVFLHQKALIAFPSTNM